MIITEIDILLAGNIQHKKTKFHTSNSVDTFYHLLILNEIG